MQIQNIPHSARSVYNDVGMDRLPLSANSLFEKRCRCFIPASFFCCIRQSARCAIVFICRNPVAFIPARNNVSQFKGNLIFRLIRKFPSEMEILFNSIGIGEWNWQRCRWHSTRANSRRLFIDFATLRATIITNDVFSASFLCCAVIQNNAQCNYSRNPGHAYYLTSLNRNVLDQHKSSNKSKLKRSPM